LNCATLSYLRKRHPLIERQPQDVAPILLVSERPPAKRQNGNAHRVHTGCPGTWTRESRNGLSLSWTQLVVQTKRPVLVSKVGCDKNIAPIDVGETRLSLEGLPGTFGREDDGCLNPF
jgi:hypothetical protein